MSNPLMRRCPVCGPVWDAADALAQILPSAQVRLLVNDQEARTFDVSCRRCHNAGYILTEEGEAFLRLARAQAQQRGQEKPAF